MVESRKHVIKVLLDLCCCIVVAVPILSLYLSGKPFRRGFNCDDTSIRYPFRDSTISSKVLQLYCLGIPIITIAVVEFIRYSKNVRLFSGGSPRQLREFSWILYNEVIVFIFGALCSQFLTDIAKYSIGRLRPHFLDVCRPKDLDGRLCGRNDFRYIEDYECTQSNGELLKDARLSFMSGHSSLSAYAMVFTAIYIQYKVKWQTLSLLRPLIQMSLIYLAIYTGFTRISDYKHHWSDVLVGLMQGTVVAVIVAHFVGKFFRQFPEKLGDESSRTRARSFESLTNEHGYLPLTSVVAAVHPTSQDSCSLRRSASDRRLQPSNSRGPIPSYRSV